MLLSPTLTGRVAGPTALSSYEPPLDDAIASTRYCGSAGSPTFLPQTKCSDFADRSLQRAAGPRGRDKDRVESIGTWLAASVRGCLRT